MTIAPLRSAKPTPTENGLLTLDEAAAYLQISPGTLKHWIAWRKIEHVKLGKMTRFRRAALDRFILQQTVAAVEDGQ